MGRRCHAPLIRLRVDAEPHPRSLVVARGRIINGKLYAIYLAECRRQIAEQPHPSEPLEGPLLVAVESVRSRPKQSDREWPAGDVDNLIKAPLDALTQVGWWGDDDQVQIAYPTKRFVKGDETAHCNIVIGRMK